MKVITFLYLHIVPGTGISHFTSFKACRHKEKGTLVPCAVGGSINRTECLENKCCPSKDRHELACYVPFRDSKYTSVNCFLIAICFFQSNYVIFICSFSFSGHKSLQSKCELAFISAYKHRKQFIDKELSELFVNLNTSKEHKMKYKQM